MSAFKSFFAVPAVKLLLRALVTTAILVFIVRSINAQQAWRVMVNARADLLVVALVLQFVSTAISAYRWQLIMCNLQFDQSFTFYWRSYFKGMFFNQGLPTSIGGDAMRVLDVAGLGFRKRDAFYGVAIDRIAGLAALILLTLVANIVNTSLLPAPVYRLMLSLTVLGLLGIASLLVLKRLSWFDRYPQLAFVKAISDHLDLAFAHRRWMLLTLSLLVPVFALLGFYAIGWALGLRFDLMTYFAIVPPALVMTIIPASIAGWGVREGALVGLFSLIGADKTVVLMMSLLYGLTLIIVSIPGLIVFLQGRHSTPAKLSAK